MELSLSNVQFTKVERPSDIIIKQIRYLLNAGLLQPGDKLPAERKLAEKYGVGRTHVREAIKKLEFYGILKTLPQSGSVVAGLDISALDSLISDVLKLDNSDFFSLVEARVILEKEAARLCALRRTEKDLADIEAALKETQSNKEDGRLSVEKDFNFHRTIAEGSHNMVLKSMLLIITPDILTIYNKHKVCDKVPPKPVDEHALLFNYIKNQEVEKAVELMGIHLQGVFEFAKNEKELFNR